MQQHRLTKSHVIVTNFNHKHRWFSGRMLACHAGGPGSIPGRCNRCNKKVNNASAGNRTRAARVAGEHSTTEPPMLII
ncbi:hypothetical protein FF38_13815 [Lucilia cuprina]|uniref:Uncharacterized protein n=1 Tax=Lucilia cuprina TaxID=7375 RepID=A0A0L0BX04_LUCCU|nr:hypothetical protein FF38_13815 [Lucilia cuprina]